MNMAPFVRIKLDDDKRGGLPSWTYTNPEFLEIEKDELFLARHGRLLCHVSDVPNIGDYYSFDLVGERALIVRGKDNAGAGVPQRLPASRQPGCGQANAAPASRQSFSCPFHGWSYNLDGTLRAVPQAKSLAQA